jgi:hypothetical protein
VLQISVGNIAFNLPNDFAAQRSGGQECAKLFLGGGQAELVQIGGKTVDLRDE